MIQAVADKIVVQLMIPTKTKGGLILPTNAQMPQGYGKVISCGELVPPESNILEGAMLVFFPSAGMDMLMDDKILKVLKYEEVYGILHNKELEDTLGELTIGGSTEEQTIVKPASSIVTP